MAPGSPDERRWRASGMPDAGGMVTRDEHLAGELDKDAANKNRDRSLTRSEIENLLGL